MAAMIPEKSAIKPQVTAFLVFEMCIRDSTYTDGNISSIAYASQTSDIATENYTYANGTLSGIRLNNWISIWQLQSEDDLGLLTNETTGPLNRVYKMCIRDSLCTKRSRNV